MSSYNEWRIESNDLQTIYDASSTDMNEVFNLLYPQGSAFMQMWVKDSIMYECLGANTNMNNSKSRADTAKRALLRFRDERSDNVTEIGQNKEYDTVSTFRGWQDYADYWTNRYDVWSTNFETIYGETWEVALKRKNTRKATNSTLRQPNQEELNEFAEKILNADINKLTDKELKECNLEHTF
jgi:hypothetical protein